MCSYYQFRIGQANSTTAHAFSRFEDYSILPQAEESVTKLLEATTDESRAELVKEAEKACRMQKPQGELSGVVLNCSIDLLLILPAAPLFLLLAYKSQ